MSKPMVQSRLTDRAVAAIKPPEKRCEIPDGLVVGLYLALTPAGSKTWCVRYRHQGRTRRLGLGAYPGVALATARDLARDALDKVARGIDPAARQERRVDTVASVYTDFHRRHVLPNLSPRSVENYDSAFRLHVLPAWGDKPIADIGRRDVNALLFDLEEKGLGVRRNRVLALVRAFLGWAAREEVIPVNPAASVRPPVVERPRQRLLTDEELGVFWRAAGAMGVTGAFVRFLLLTGCRRSEAAEATWGEIEGATWTIPEGRAKNGRRHVVHLAEPTRALLDDLPRFAGTDAVFSTTGRGGLAGFNKVKARLDRAVTAEHG